MKRVWLAIITALVCYSLVDILIWQRIFEVDLLFTTVLAERQGYYREAWRVVMIGLVAVGSIGFGKEKLKMLFFAGATMTLAHSGIEDVLYYWLDGRQIPDYLPWLDQAPFIIRLGEVTREGLLLSAIIWLAMWLLMSIWIAKATDKLRM